MLSAIANHTPYTNPPPGWHPGMLRSYNRESFTPPPIQPVPLATEERYNALLDIGYQRLFGEGDGSLSNYAVPQMPEMWALQYKGSMMRYKNGKNIISL